MPPTYDHLIVGGSIDLTLQVKCGVQRSIWVELGQVWLKSAFRESFVTDQIRSIEVKYEYKLEIVTLTELRVIGKDYLNRYFNRQVL